jgi:ferredoxin
MTWVITRLCRDCLDTSCVEVCPVDCIYQYVGPQSDKFPNQLYIDPEECIDCQACEPVCPWEAPLCDADVPAVLQGDIALNASIVECKDTFRVPPHTDKPQPTTTDVAANKAKWGWTG